MTEYSGQCLCGRIAFKTTGDPLWVAHCHCHSCRRNTGSVLATFVGYAKSQVRFSESDRSFYASSPGVKRGFCSTCGTPVSYEGDWCPDEIHFYVSTFDDPEKFIPDRHVFVGERISWFEVHDDLPRYAGTSERSKPFDWGPLHNETHAMKPTPGGTT